MSELDKPTYGVIETARILGVGKNAMYAAVKAGQVKTIRINKRDRIPKAWIENVSAQARRRPDQERPPLAAGPPHSRLIEIRPVYAAF